MASLIIRCYICRTKSPFYCPNILIQTSRHTDTPIIEFLQKFAGQLLFDKDDTTLANQVICEDCLLKINEYDLACMTAKNIENELRSLLNLSQEFDHQMYIKTEPVLKVEPDINVGDSDLDVFGMSPADLSDPDYEYEQPKPDPKELDLKSKLKKKLKKEKKERKKKKKEDSKINIPEDLKCEICALQLRNSNSYKRHLHNHLGLLAKPKFSCQICQANYKTNEELEVHAEKHRSLEANPLQCVECLKMFSSRNNLARHLPIHTGEKLYICELCGRDFIHYSSFREHKLIHANIKTKECPTCGRLFGQSSHLARHIRTHTGEKPYTCAVCDRRFANKYNMRSHMKIHQESDGSEPHICIVCNRAFAKAVLLKGHMKRSHQQAMGEEIPMPMPLKQFKLISETVTPDFKLVSETVTPDFS